MGIQRNVDTPLSVRERSSASPLHGTGSAHFSVHLLGTHLLGCICWSPTGRSIAAPPTGSTHFSVQLPFLLTKVGAPSTMPPKVGAPAVGACSYDGYPCTAFPIHLRLAGTALRRYRFLLPLLNFCLKPVIICQEFFQPCIGQRMVQRFLQHRVWHRCDVRPQASCFHNVHRMAK